MGTKSRPAALKREDATDSNGAISNPRKIRLEHALCKATSRKSFDYNKRPIEISDSDDKSEGTSSYEAKTEAGSRKGGLQLG